MRRCWRGNGVAGGLRTCLRVTLPSIPSPLNTATQEAMVLRFWLRSEWRARCGPCGSGREAAGREREKGREGRRGEKMRSSVGEYTIDVDVVRRVGNSTARAVEPRAALEQPSCSLQVWEGNRFF